MEKENITKEKILIVDDSEMNRSILVDMLSDEFDADEAENGVEAVSILSKHSDRYSVILLDIVMPEMDGFGVLEAMNERGWIESLPVIMISAETKASQIERAYNLGASDFIMRPFDASIVHRRVVNTVLLYAKQKKLINIIENQIYEKEQNSNMMVDILSHIVEFRNGESGLHIRNVRALTDFLLTRLCAESDKYNLSENDIAVITMASALHDIGKISIDEHILNKPGKLTDEEFEIMKRHSLIGAKMLENLPDNNKENSLVNRAYEICRWHHERYDGKGYPDGLKGDEIPISAQIVALADVYDALTSERVYKKPIPHEEAIKMIADGKCGAFNSELIRCLIANADKIRNALSDDVTEKQARVKIRSFAEAVLHSKTGGVSERTLRLLDYERMKYNFFAAMTQEIQFEYVVSTDTLTLSSFGAKKLGLEEKIRLKDNIDKLNEIFGNDWLEKIKEQVAATTPEKPEFKNERRIKLNGENKWVIVIIRSIWSDDVPPKTEGVIGKIVDMTESHTKIGELVEKALHDPLTGLWNRAGASEQIEKRILSYPAHRYAILLFDVDYFKNANDTYGHLFGDKVLKGISDRMMHSTRMSDICARIGGDEFLIFLEYDTDVKPIVDRIFGKLKGKIDNFDLTVSMGVVEMNNENQTYEELFHKADTALYYSKQSGRAQYNIYDDSMGDVLLESDISEILNPASEAENNEKGE